MNGQGQKNSKRNKEKKKKNFLSNFRLPGRDNRGSRNMVDAKNHVSMVVDEGGLLDVYILTLYMVFFLTMMAFLMGIGFGNLKEAHAKYGYLAESMTFAAEAANMTGMIGGVEENEEMAMEYFDVVMTEMVEDYELEDFYAVEEGDYVPGGGTAQAAGFIAEVTVPLKKVTVPFIGEQQINAPMAYFAVTKSETQP